MGEVRQIVLPGPDGWELWKRDGSSCWTPDPSGAGVPKNSAECLVAHDTRSLAMVPLWIASTDPEIQSAVVEGQLGDLGVVAEGGRPSHLQSVAVEGSRSLVVATVVESNARLPEVSGVPAGFAPHASLYELPADSLCLWRELGALVVAFTRGSKLVYSQLLSQRQLDGGLAGELGCLAASLHGSGMIKKPSRLVVATGREEDAPEPGAEGLGEILGLPVQLVPRLPLRAGLEPLSGPEIEASPFSPQPVAALAAARRAQGRNLRLALLGAAVYALLCLAAFLHLRKLGEGQGALQASLDRDAAEVEKIRGAMERWEALEPSLNPNGYVVETFHRLTEILPREGLRLTQFHLDDFGNNLTVVGEAESTRAAIALRDDLANQASLGHYEWEIPVPVTLPDSRARFWAKGKWMEPPAPIGTASNPAVASP